MSLVLPSKKALVGGSVGFTNPFTPVVHDSNGVAVGSPSSPHTASCTVTVPASASKGGTIRMIVAGGGSDAASMYVVSVTSDVDGALAWNNFTGDEMAFIADLATPTAGLHTITLEVAGPSGVDGMGFGVLVIETFSDTIERSTYVSGTTATQDFTETMGWYLLSGREVGMVGIYAIVIRDSIDDNIDTHHGTVLVSGNPAENWSITYDIVDTEAGETSGRVGAEFLAGTYDLAIAYYIWY